MSTDLNAVVNATGQEIVNGAADIIAKDVKNVILSGQQFQSPESEAPSTLEAVQPLSYIRKLRKRQLGYSNPSLARFGTGALLNSIAAEYGELTATVDASAASADVQQEGGGPWTDELGYSAPGTPARPFMGVSTNAYNSIKEMAEQKLEAMKAKLEPVELDTVRMTI